MGKLSNKRKSVQQPVALVKVFSKGGITLQSHHEFSPMHAAIVAHAFRHFVNDRVDQGIELVAKLQSLGYDFFDFTMSSTTNAQLGNADPLIWAWGAASAASLRWLMKDSLNKGRIDLMFFAIIPHQLQLVEEGSELCQLGSEVFTMFARYLIGLYGPAIFGDLFTIAPRACAIVNDIVAEMGAVAERGELDQSTLPKPSQPSLQNTTTARL